MNIEFIGKIWFWRGPAPWFFVTVPAEQSRDLKAISGFVTYGWGVIPVQVRIGKTEWQTSLFPKEGRYLVPIKARDLPIALGILAASGQLPKEALASYEFAGELALSGELRPIRGVLPMSLQTRNAGRTLVVPQQNGAEAALVESRTVLIASHLLQVCAHLAEREKLPQATVDFSQARAEQPDLVEVLGQHQARRALEIAAAGAHSLLMSGPPGTGKTMLASRLPGILPEMGEQEAIESAALASISDSGFNRSLWKVRPFRSPHHTASAVALVGGGSHPRPGEISLAHHGVLFLDELPEFDRKVLEVLREPLLIQCRGDSQ